MAQDSNASSKRYAVVTGGNRGLGFEICKQLASNGVTVVLTARDEKRGNEAVEKLRGFGISNDSVLFRQLDVTDPSTISSLVQFVQSNFGRLDILVNNAGVIGLVADENSMKAAATGTKINWMDALTTSYEMTKECIDINYYGSKAMIEAFLPLLQFSKSPRIVNVTSGWAKLQHFSNVWAKGVLTNVEESTGEKIDEVVKEFLEDYKKGSIAEKGWPKVMGAYAVSKAAMNAYTRITAKKYPNMQVNCVSPGWVKTDITFNIGVLTPEQGASHVVRVALQPQDGPSGVFFDQQEVIPF